MKHGPVCDSFDKSYFRAVSGENGGSLNRTAADIVVKQRRRHRPRTGCLVKTVHADEIRLIHRTIRVYLEDHEVSATGIADRTKCVLGRIHIGSRAKSCSSRQRYRPVPVDPLDPRAWAVDLASISRQRRRLGSGAGGCNIDSIRRTVAFQPLYPIAIVRYGSQPCFVTAISDCILLGTGVRKNEMVMGPIVDGSSRRNLILLRAHGPYEDYLQDCEGRETKTTGCQVVHLRKPPLD